VTLLDRIRDPRDQDAWGEFVDLYGPLIYGFARKRVPQDQDAADVMREVLCAVARGTYERCKGPFHKWLLTVKLNETRDVLARYNGRIQLIGSADLEKHAATVEEEWDRDHKQRLFDRAAEFVRTETNSVLWQAFWLTTVEGKTGMEAARTLGLTVSNVYSSKSRILAQIRKLVNRMQEE
jgi:RNA polymerase sigma-70 factor (ECF subfamily)